MAKSKKKKEQTKAEKEQIVKKQKAREAVTPPPPAFIRSVIEQAKPKTKPSEEDERVLLALSQSDAWKVLKRHIKKKLKRLHEATTAQAMSAGTDFNEIGFRFLMFELVKSNLNDVIKIVERPAEVRQIQKEEKDAIHKEG